MLSPALTSVLAEVNGAQANLAYVLEYSFIIALVIVVAVNVADQFFYKKRIQLREELNKETDSFGERENIVRRLLRTVGFMLFLLAGVAQLFLAFAH